MSGARHTFTRSRKARGALLLVAFAVIGAGIAHAATLTNRTKTVVLPSNGVIDGVAQGCRGDTKAIGGGAELGDVSDYITGSYPIGDDQWAATGYHIGAAAEDGTLTVHARCAKGLRMVSRSETTTLPKVGAGDSVTAICPRGTKVAGGGIKMSDEDYDWLVGSYPSGPRSWTASAYGSPLGQDPSSITAYARCLRGARITTEKTTAFVPGANEVRSARATCPRGTRLTGGGIKLGKDDSLDYPRGSYPASRRSWVVKGSRGEKATPTSSTLTAYARCLH